MKKIMYLMEFPIDLPGGGQMSTQTLCEGIMGDEYETIAVCPKLLKKNVSDYPFKVIEYTSDENREKNKLLRVLNFLRRIGSFYRIIKKEKPDIIHVSMSESLITYGFLRCLGIFKKIPFIYTDRGLCYGYRKYSKKCILATLKHAERMVCTTHFNENLWLKENPGCEITVIPNTISDAFENYDDNKRQEMRNKYHLSGDDFVVGFAGRISEEKDWDFVPELVKALKDDGLKFKIALVISIYEQQDEAIVADIKSRIIDSIGEENLIYLQDLSQKDMADYYYLTDVFVMSSMFESFGKAAVEAMSRKCAVVSTSVGGLTEVIGREEDLYTKDTVDKFVKRIRLLKEDASCMNSDREYFYNRYKENYTRTVHLERHKKLYRDLIKPNNGKTTEKPGLLKSFIDYFYGNFIVLLLGFVSLPLITRVMSTDEYGRTAMFTSAVSIIYIFAILGLDQAYIRYFYKEGVNRKRLMRQCLQYPLILIVVLAGAYWAFADFFNGFLFGRSAIDITLLVVAYTIISVFERFLFLNIRMEQKGKLYSNLNILSKVLYIVFILLFVKLIGDDFRVVLYALTLPLGIVTLICAIRYIFVNRHDKAETHDLKKAELLKYGIPFVPMLLMEWLLSSMDKWSIKIFNDFAETGIYSSAMQIMTILLTFKITYVAFWAPVAMEKYEKEPEDVVKPFFKDMFQKVQFLCMCAAFLLTIFRGVIVMILGADYREAIKIIPYLSLMPILSILFEMTGQGCKFVGKVKYFNYASLAAIICNLVGNTLLVPILGGIGAALATAVTYVVYFLLGTYFSNRCYPISYDLKRFWMSMILYGAYATYATWSQSIWISAFVGIVLLMIHCIINKDTLSSLWKYCVGLVKGLKK